jgi:hypothetical protein
MQFRFLLISFWLCIASTQASQAQLKPKFEFGTILSTSYKKSQEGDTPLTVNDGSGTFLTQWDVLLGVRVLDDLSFYADLQTIFGYDLIVYGMSALYQPFESGVAGIEVGKFLAPFGNFLSRRWASETPLIDYHLTYQYRSVISAYELPRNEQEILGVRGNGQHFYYGSGSTGDAMSSTEFSSSYAPGLGSGLRIIAGPVYLTGVQLFGRSGRFQYNLGLTNGALSNPVNLNNSGRVQINARLTYNPVIGLILGTSFADGAYLDYVVDEELEAMGRKNSDYSQTAVGFDATYSIGHLILFSELILNRWQSPYIDEDLKNYAFYIEASYTFLPRFWIATRLSWLHFSDIDDVDDIDNNGSFRDPWDFPVNQKEIGIGYHVNRNTQLKIMLQFNHTEQIPDGDPADDLFAVQGVVYF